MEQQKRDIRAIYDLYVEIQDPGLLNEAIRKSRRVLAEAPPALNPIEETRAEIMNNLVVFLDIQNENMWTLETEEEALFLVEQIEQGTPRGRPGREMTLLNLASRYKVRYDRTHMLHDLEKGLRAGKKGMEETKPDDPNRGDKLNLVGVLSSLKYKRTMNVEDLQEAIRWAEEAVEATPFNHESRSMILNNLCGIISCRYEKESSPHDLDNMIRFTKDAIASDLQFASYHVNLLNWFVKKCRITKKISDIQEAIQWGQMAIWVVPLNNIDRSTALAEFGTLFNLRYESFGNIEDLHTSILYSSKAASSVIDEHPSRAVCFNNLAARLHERYRILGNLEDLEKAVDWGNKAVSTSQEGSRDLRERMNTLAMCLIARYEAKSTNADLEKAIIYCRDATARAMADTEESPDPERPNILINFGGCLYAKFKATGQIDDLQEAIHWKRESVRCCPPGHPSRPRSLCNLAISLCTRYEALGTTADLDKAILMIETELAGMTIQGANTGELLYNLGNFLSLRYRRTESLEDLQQAINWFERALEAIAPGRPIRALVLDALAFALGIRHERTDNSGDLVACIKTARQAVEAIPNGHLMEVMLLSNAGNRLTKNYESTMLLSDLEDALNYHRQAREKCSEIYHDMPSILTNFGACLVLKYQATKELDDLQQCISVIEESVSKTPSVHVHLVDRLNYLGTLYETKYRRTVNQEDSEKSLSSYLDAWNCSNALPESRICTAWSAVDLLIEKSRFEEATGFLNEGIKLLPLMSPRSLQRVDQQHRLSKFSGLASIGCSVALMAGRSPAEAIAFLELGRGVLLGYSIDSRSDISHLGTADAQLYQKFDELRIEVETPLKTDGDSFQVRNNKLRRRAKAISELENALVGIRRLPGNENFQLPPTQSGLQEMAREGPIVVLNANRLRTEAIIIRETGIIVMDFPGLQQHHMNSQLVEYLAAADGYHLDRRQRNQKMKGVLLWLWDTMVEPVFKELGFEPKAETKDLPRVWWIASGITNRFPFHAAGDHSAGSTRNVLSHALFSYTPTIKSLSYSREKKWTVSQQAGSQALLVTMAHTPGQTSLPGVLKERDAIISTIADRVNIKILNQPTLDTVTAQLANYEIIHFACHGDTNARNPSASHLLLLPSPSSSSTDPIGKLTAHAVSRLARSARSQLAYLSACRTAENPSLLLADEVISLATGFQLAGYAHVVATMWNASDQAAVGVAEGFYSKLLSAEAGGDGGEGGHRRVVEALREAVVEARGRWEEDFLSWAPFIHLGA